MTCDIYVPNRFTSEEFCDSSKFKLLDYSPRSYHKLLQEFNEYQQFVNAITETISSVAKTSLTDNIMFMIRDFTESLGIRWLKLRHNANICPHCHMPAKKNGSAHGKPKFTCYNTKSHDDGKIHSFNPDTSFEARVFWYISTIVSLAHIAMGVTEKHISMMLAIPKLIVEESVKIGARTFKLEHFRVHNSDAETATVIYIDESGAFFRGALIAARIGDKIYVRLATVPTNLDLKLFFDELKKIVDSANIVVVTDGKPDYVALVKSTWPDAIHVAQFHDRDVLGQVHVYFKYEEKDYTIRMPWDVFIRTEVMENVILPASTDVVPHGRKTQIGKYRVTKVKLFDKTVLYPYRPKSSRTSKPKERGVKKKTSEGGVEPKRELQEIYIPRSRNPEEVKIRTSGRAVCIASVEVSRWREHPIIAHALTRIEPIFSGKHVTSYPVENVFSILKPLMYIHRTEKSVLDLARVILFFFSLGSLTWYQLLNEIVKQLPFSLFLKEFGKRRACTRKRETVKVHRNGIYDIEYVRLYGGKEVRTRRRIIVQSIRKKGNRIYIYAFCMLRNERRTFLASRITQIKEVI